MKSNLVKSSVCILLCSVVLSGCSTTINSYPVKDGAERKGGIPFFLPKPILQVREPIEIKRIETLYAVMDVGGLEQVAVELKHDDINNSLERIKNILKTGEIDVEFKEKVPFYLKEKTDKTTDQTGQYQQSVSEHTEKYDAQTVSDTKSDLKPLYKPSDVEKSISVIWVPNVDKEYELVITPSSFASSDLSIKLTDGWKLESITAKTGDNQLIKELSDTLRTVIGAQKEVKIAEITREQAVKLKEMELSSKADEGQKTMSFVQERKKVPIRIVGFVRKTVITAIEPGLHELIFDSGTVKIPKNETMVWEKISL